LQQKRVVLRKGICHLRVGEPVTPEREGRGLGGVAGIADEGFEVGQRGWEYVSLGRLVRTLVSFGVVHQSLDFSREWIESQTSLPRRLFCG